jgi:hypothetical protein
MTTDLDIIFNDLQEIMKEYDGILTRKSDKMIQNGLWTGKEAILGNRKYPDMFFVGIGKNKDNIGLYYMPVYMHPEVKAMLHPNLVKLLKGKSCFHIKMLDDSMKIHIKEALKIGIDLFRQKGWI